MSKSLIKEYKVNGIHIITYPISKLIQNDPYVVTENYSNKELEYLIWLILGGMKYGPFNNSGGSYCVHNHSDDPHTREFSKIKEEMYEDAKKEAKSLNLPESDFIFLDNLYRKRENTKLSECDGCSLVKNNTNVVAVHCYDCMCNGCKCAWYFQVHSSFIDKIKEYIK